MSILRAIIMAFSCFSTIPMPTIDWDENNMRYMMAAFPVVGVVIGALLVAWQSLAVTLGFGTILTGAGFTLIPILVSGGIHLDGFADVMDAQSSHADAKRRLEIMRDPHIGAFAAISVGCYLIAHFALACEVEPSLVTLLSCSPVISRCLSGLATVTFRPAKKQGMLASEQSTARTGAVQTVLAATFAVVSGLMLYANPYVAALMLVSSAVTLAFVVWLADRSYGGLSGDLAGFFLQLAELAMLASIVVMGRLV